MKRTVQVNLSGQAFTLDEDAYELLTSYLARISKLYDRSVGKDEIIQDIEARIAELFLEKLSDSKSVIDQKDVQEVVAILGNPEEFESDSEEEYNESKNAKSRRLYRDPEDRVIGGVCAGLGHYFGLEPMWFRLAFAFALIFFGTGVILYVILWAIIPIASSTAERLEMKGEPVNVGSIGKTIEEELNNLSDAMKNGGKADAYAQKVVTGIEGFFQFLIRLILLLFRFIGKILGVFFSFTGVIVIIALIAMIMGVADAFHFSHATWDASFSIYEMGRLIFDSSAWFGLALLGGALLTLCPFLLLAYGGLSLLHSSFRVPYLPQSLFGLWLVGVGISVFVAISTVQEFSKEDSSSEAVPLAELGITSDTIRIDLGDDPFNIPLSRAYGANRDFMLRIEDSHVMLGDVRVDIEPAKDNIGRLRILRSANGRYFHEAKERAESISYLFQHTDNSLKFNAYLKFPQSDCYRDQQVTARIELPIGKTVYLARASKRIIYNITNVHNMYDPRMVGHHWKMTSDGLACMDCEGIDSPEVEDEDAPADSTVARLDAVPPLGVI